jgi:hypothetical protein
MRTDLDLPRTLGRGALAASTRTAAGLTLWAERDAGGRERLAVAAADAAALTPFHGDVERSGDHLVLRGTRRRQRRRPAGRRCRTCGPLRSACACRPASATASAWRRRATWPRCGRSAPKSGSRRSSPSSRCARTPAPAGPRSRSSTTPPSARSRPAGGAPWAPTPTTSSTRPTSTRTWRPASRSSRSTRASTSPPTRTGSTAPRCRRPSSGAPRGRRWPRPPPTCASGSARCASTWATAPSPSRRASWSGRP